jgi:hypothetical protein
MSLGEKDASEVLGSLQGKGDHFTKLSVIERKRRQDLEDAITHITKETERYRSLGKKVAIEVMNKNVLTPNPAYQRADGVSVARDAQIVTSKALMVLEKQVNALLQRKSMVIIENKALKLEIDHFRLMRISTDASHAQFDEVLRVQKQQIEERLAESAAIVEQREKLVTEKEALEIVNREEQRRFEEEFNEMGAFIKQQNDALELSLLQERKEDQKKRGGMGAKTSGSEADDGAGTGINSSSTLDEEVAMARQLGSLAQYAQSEASFLSSIEAKIQGYEAMFEQLKKMSGTESLDEVVAGYVATEEEMFSLYNYMQTLNSDIEAVLEQTVQLDHEVTVHTCEQDEQDSIRHRILDELQTRMQATSEATQQAEEENKMLQEYVLQIGKKVNTLFFKIQCDQMDSKGKEGADGKGGAGGAGAGGQASSTRKGATMSRPEGKVALLQQQGVTDSNVLEFLGCIEQRSVDVISEYLRRQASGKPNFPLSPTPGPASPMHMAAEQPHVDIDQLADEDLAVDGEDDGRIVDLSSFKTKLKRRLVSTL